MACLQHVDSCREVAARWQRGGSEVAVRWQRGGSEVAARLKRDPVWSCAVPGGGVSSGHGEASGSSRQGRVLIHTLQYWHVWRWLGLYRWHGLYRCSGGIHVNGAVQSGLLSV